jgi:hypothetical protein
MDESGYNLIISVLILMSNLILHLKFRHCHSACFDSDCKATPSNTPTLTPTTSSHFP